MARTYNLAVSLNGTPVPALAVEASLLPDGQSSATVDLDPTVTTAAGVNESDSWDIRLSYGVPAGGTTTQGLMTGARARGASYAQSYSGGSSRNVEVVRRVQLEDRFAAFRDHAPSADTTRTGTDSHRELAYVCGRIGISGAVASVARVAIDRIDYRRDQSYFDSLWPYFAPFEPLVFLDPSTSALRVIDSTVLHSAAPRSDRVLTLADYNPASWQTDLRPVVTQVRVDYRAFGQSTLGAKVSPSASRVEEEITENDDGTITRTWTGFLDLYEDTSAPTTITRTVTCEQGVTTTDGGALISSTVTAMSYMADYSLLVETTSVVTATVELPIVGQWTGEVERTVEEYDYEPDTVVPGRYVLKRKTATTSGVYVYEYSSADPDGALGAATATPVVSASHAATTDVDRVSSGLGDGEYIAIAKPSSSQRFATGRTRVVTETYRRSHASNVVTVVGQETDSLRGKVVRTWRRTELGDNTITPVGRTAFVWLRGDDTYGERAAAVVDAQVIGLPLGRQIGERILAQSGQPIRTARITLTRPDYRRYRLGWLVRLDTDAPYDMAGLWLIRGVAFAATAPSDAQPPVTQTLQLERRW